MYQNSLTPLGHYDKSNTPERTAFIIAAGSAGEVGYHEEPFWAADDCFYLLPHADTTSKFLYYSLTSQQQHISGLVRRGSVPRLARDIVQNLELRLPPREVQVKIVDAISSVDHQIEALYNLTAKYEAIKKATVKLLLKPKDGWRKVKVKDFCPLQRGFDLPKRLRREGKYPLVCSNGIVDRIDTALQKAPGVVTGRSGTIGSVHYVTEDYWPHNTTLWVTKFIDADPMFVYHLLSNMNLTSFSGGSGVPTLNRNNIHETIISVPTIHKQREIAAQISAIDNMIKICHAQLTKAQSLKHGMMTYFFG